MAQKKDKQEAELPLRCVCGREPCTVKSKGRYMTACPDGMRCSMRGRWKKTEQAAVKDWNTTIQAARHQRGGKSWHRVKRQRNPVAGRSTPCKKMAWCA